MMETAQRQTPLEQVKHCVAAISAPTLEACMRAKAQITDWDVKLPLLHGYLFDSFLGAAESDVLRFCQNFHHMTEGNYLLQLTTSDHLKLFHLAARQGFTTVIEFLLSIGEEIDCRGPNHMTALWIASRNNKPNSVALLLQHGASLINWRCAQSNRQISAAQIAAVYKHHRVLEVLSAERCPG